MRTLKVTSPTLTAIWNEKKELHDSIKSIISKRESDEKELNKLSIKMEKLREKTVKETMKLKFDISDFETITQYDLDKDVENGVIFEIRDDLELYKQQYLARKNTPK